MKNKPDYLLIERGRYYYQRKVPLELQSAVGQKKWRAPLGNDFDLAYDKLRDLRREHEALIASLADPESRQDHKTRTRRTREKDQAATYAAADAAHDEWCRQNGELTEAEEFSLAFPDHDPGEEWRDTADWLAALEGERERHKHEHLHVTVEGQKSFFPEPLDDDEYHDRLVGVYRSNFGEHIKPPLNPDERDEFDFLKMKLERKIARVARDPDTLRSVAERFYAFAQLRSKTEDKYRRTVERCIEHVGNIPISQVTSKMLREYRDQLKARGLVPSSIRSEFSPLMGLFSYAVDEEIIEISPMVSVKLPKERRAVEETKWLPFTPEEATRIFAAMHEIWGQKVAGVSEERRQALTMAVRVLAHTAMRPAEFMALRPDQVDERAIRVEGGKTKSSWRVIPLHPAIADFPAWLHAHGMSAFHNSKTGNQQTDTVTVLRHNFRKLISVKMATPITDSRKVLYSWRSTFQNAMRRAGAPKDVRRAILGHVESGAIRHYDDGPEFDLLKEWVEKTDPLRSGECDVGSTLGADRNDVWAKTQTERTGAM